MWRVWQADSEVALPKRDPLQPAVLCLRLVVQRWLLCGQFSEDYYLTSVHMSHMWHMSHVWHMSLVFRFGGRRASLTLDCIAWIWKNSTQLDFWWCFSDQNMRTMSKESSTQPIIQIQNHLKCQNKYLVILTCLIWPTKSLVGDEGSNSWKSPR